MLSQSKTELYAAIRRDMRGGMSIRAVMRKHSVSYLTVTKASASAWPELRKNRPRGRHGWHGPAQKPSRPARDNNDGEAWTWPPRALSLGTSGAAYAYRSCIGQKPGGRVASGPGTTRRTITPSL